MPLKGVFLQGNGPTFPRNVIAPPASDMQVRDELALPRPNVPYDPIVSRTPFFYGWVMLPIAVAGGIATSPGQTYAISVFNDSFRESLSLSHTQLTGAYMAGTLMAAFPILFVGALMDRFGIRLIMGTVVVLFGAVCIGVSQVNSLVALFFAFFLLRTLGQGALSLLSSNTLAMWFNRRLGTASGIMSLGTAASVAIVPAFIHLGLGSIGWRWTYACLGLAVWSVMIPLLVVFFRNRPEEIGQEIDGDPPRTKQQTIDSEKKGDSSLTMIQAIATRAFWILLLCNMSWALIGTGLMFNIKPLYFDHGLAEIDTTLFYTYIAISMASMQFVGGWLADRMRLSHLIFVALAGMTSAVALIHIIEDSRTAAIFAITLGGSQGLFIVAMQTVWARYFGRTHLGKIRGLVWTSAVAGSSVGPFVMGVLKDYTGGFDISLWIFTGIYAILACAVLFATPPRPAPLTAS